MDLCEICQDFRINVGYDTDNTELCPACPKNTSKRGGQHNDTKLECMLDFENFPLPNEIMFKIFNYLDTQSLYHCCQVSKRIRSICLSNHLKSNSTLLKVVDLMNEEPSFKQTALPVLCSKKWHVFVNFSCRNSLVEKM